MQMKKKEWTKTFVKCIYLIFQFNFYKTLIEFFLNFRIVTNLNRNKLKIFFVSCNNLKIGQQTKGNFTENFK